MANKYLAREDAPIGSDTWKLLDATLVETAKSELVDRRLLHIDGPFGRRMRHHDGVGGAGRQEFSRLIFGEIVAPRAERSDGNGSA